MKTSTRHMKRYSMPFFAFSYDSGHCALEMKGQVLHRTRAHLNVPG